MPRSSSLYAVIDLGSNSFHMLVVRNVAGSIQTLARVKRKVRLAAGLDSTNTLSAEAMARGWHCLRLFAEHLHGISCGHIRVVATATLRLAVNASDFIDEAQQILGCPVNVITGEEEARLIYQGVAYTTAGSGRRLVVDIGGGSTELVTGNGAQATFLCSLAMGCVTWLDRYFFDRHLSQANFDRAEQAAAAIIRPLAQQLRQQGWQVCVGASGTVQALQEIMVAQGMDERITPEKLQQLKRRAIQCGKLEELEIAGLTLERALVFPSGLSILIAIFTELHIDSMTLSGGALREGLVYGMLHLPVEPNIRHRTLHNIQRRFGIDCQQAECVRQLAENMAQQVEKSWNLDRACLELLDSACLIHEIGLSIDLRQAPQHAAYLVQHLDLPGFTPAQKKLLAILLNNQVNSIDLTLLTQQNALPARQAGYLCRLLRLSVIFASSRHHGSLPAIQLQAKEDSVNITLPADWTEAHPLSAEMLEQECHWQSYVHWPLVII